MVYLDWKTTPPHLFKIVSCLQLFDFYLLLNYVLFIFMSNYGYLIFIFPEGYRGIKNSCSIKIIIAPNILYIYYDKQNTYYLNWNTISFSFILCLISIYFFSSHCLTASLFFVFVLHSCKCLWFWRCNNCTFWYVIKLLLEKLSDTLKD